MHPTPPEEHVLVPVAMFCTPAIPAVSRVLLYYMSMSLEYEWVYVKDGTVADLLGISVEYLRQYRSRLKDRGLLVSRGTPAGTKGPCLQKHAYQWVRPETRTH